MASNLIIPIINGISDALHNINPDAKIYTDTPDNVQPNDAGYFLIQGPISITETRFLKSRHQLRLMFDIMYFPPDMAAADTGLLSTAAFAMSEELYQITPAEQTEAGYTKRQRGSRGYGRTVEIEDGVVHLLTSYDLWVTTPQKKELVQSVTITFGKHE